MNEASVKAETVGAEPLDLVEVLRARVKRTPNARVLRFVEDGAVSSVDLTYEALDADARALAAVLQRDGATGERVLILLKPGRQYVVSIWACFYAGAIAVPSYPPTQARSLARVRGISSNAECRFVLAEPELEARAAEFASRAPEFRDLRWVTAPPRGSNLADEWVPPRADPARLALLQYTSGSTDEPKGVMISHGNLLHNSSFIRRAFELNEGERGLSWLPPYHDMGLIGGLLQPVFSGLETVIFSPADFLRRPLFWLECISRYRVTCSGGPGFAYDACVKALQQGASAEGLDLSSWQVAFVGAEAVRARTLHEFGKAFAKVGFARSAFLPCYGLAEATLIVSGACRQQEPVVEAFDAGAYREGRLLPATGSEAQVTLVGCGPPVQPGSVAIVEPGTRQCSPDGHVGEIWVRNPSVAQGYWRRPEVSADSFGATLADAVGQRYLRTGDLGFVRNGELFISGRTKEIIIVRGMKHHATDIEATVRGADPALEPCVVAAVGAELGGEEVLVVVVELPSQLTLDAPRLAARAAHHVASQHGIRLADFVPVRAGQMARTSSGKIQRFAVLEAYREGKLKRFDKRSNQSGVTSRAAASAVEVDGQ